MPTIIDHAAMLTLLDEEFQAVEELCRDLDEVAWNTPTCLPGWSVRDNVSHMIGTESLLLGRQAPESNGGGERDYVKNPIGQANEVWVESMRSSPGAAVAEAFHEVAALRLDALSKMTQADFDAPSWTPAGPNETYGRFMRIRHFDCYMHEHDIRSALGLDDRPSPPHLTSALDEIATGVGYIVGKRAKMPSGTHVRIELRGPVERVFLVDVEERAAVVDELAGPPTVTVEMPAMLFLRLTGGREDGLLHLDKAISASGDRNLATALIANLAFTI